MASIWRPYDKTIKALLLKHQNDNPKKPYTFYAKVILGTRSGSHIDGRVAELSRYIQRNEKAILDMHEGIPLATSEIDIPLASAKHLWIKTKAEKGKPGVSAFVKNPDYVDTQEEIEKEIDFLSIFKDEIKPVVVSKKNNISESALFDRLVLTDIHIGMDVNKDGYALYHGEWNEEKLFERLDIVIKHTLKHQKSKKIIIHDLGDYLDGFDGLTTRGGHKLPQNMDNQQMFDVGLKFKIKLVDSLIPYFDTIQFVNICNDNHAGSFGYIVNSAFKQYIELKYKSGIEVINQRKFIDHYIFENRCFILTHGKDDKSLKFGFKPILDSSQIEKIKNYIDEHKIHSHKIEFSKGDSHQLILDFTSSTSFEYQNFGAFSPPSDWVKTNFKNSISCFTHFNYYENQKSINNYIF